MPTGQLADSCALWTGFDISIVARNYAQLAGVLAGFAFVVINLVLDRGYRRRGDGRARSASEIEHETLTGVALMNAFLGLFLSAIQYSLLAGENGCSLTGGRAASAELLGGDARQTLRFHCRGYGSADRGVLHRGDAVGSRSRPC